MDTPHSTNIQVTANPQDLATTLMTVLRQESVATHFFRENTHFTIFMEVKKPNERTLRRCSTVYLIKEVSQEFWEQLQTIITTMLQQHLGQKDLLGYLSARIVREDVFLHTSYYDAMPHDNVGFFMHFFALNIHPLPSGGQTCLIPIPE